MVADDDSRRSATLERPIPEDQIIPKTVVPRHPGKEPVEAPETNTLEYADDEYDKEYYEDDYYPVEVAMVRQQLDEADSPSSRRSTKPTRQV